MDTVLTTTAEQNVSDASSLGSPPQVDPPPAKEAEHEAVERDLSGIGTLLQLKNHLMRFFPPIEPTEDINKICDVFHENKIVIMLSELDTEECPWEATVGTKICYVKEVVINDWFPDMLLLRTASKGDEAWSARLEIDTTSNLETIDRYSSPEMHIIW